jgi:hypothetical protein
MSQGAMDGKIPKIAYFRSLYDVSSFMLEGAGSVNLSVVSGQRTFYFFILALQKKDGSTESVVLNFAGTNGRPNNMIGDVLMRPAPLGFPIPSSFLRRNRFRRRGSFLPKVRAPPPSKCARAHQPSRDSHAR